MELKRIKEKRMAPANPPVVFCSLSTTGLTLKSLKTIYGIELGVCSSGFECERGTRFGCRIEHRPIIVKMRDCGLKFVCMGISPDETIPLADLSRLNPILYARSGHLTR
jgi:hypothetical protein